MSSKIEGGTKKLVARITKSLVCVLMNDRSVTAILTGRSATRTPSFTLRKLGRLLTREDSGVDSSSHHRGIPRGVST
jgi:hypothetical protein